MSLKSAHKRKTKSFKPHSPLQHRAVSCWKLKSFSSRRFDQINRNEKPKRTEGNHCRRKVILLSPPWVVELRSTNMAKTQNEQSPPSPLQGRKKASKPASSDSNIKGNWEKRHSTAFGVVGPPSSIHSNADGHPTESLPGHLWSILAHIYGSSFWSGPFLETPDDNDDEAKAQNHIINRTVGNLSSNQQMAAAAVLNDSLTLSSSPSLSQIYPLPELHRLLASLSRSRELSGSRWATDEAVNRSDARPLSSEVLGSTFGGSDRFWNEGERGNC